ncbi:hypothetical protein K469DRAFT_602673, partial [Zopfia rhizophila CBS 207.26]
VTPVRIPLVCLFASAKVSCAAEDHLPYLLPRGDKSHYKIVLPLNSSVKEAEAERSYFNLPSRIKAYGDPAALAADPDIDLMLGGFASFESRMQIQRLTLKLVTQNRSEMGSIRTDVPDFLAINRRLAKGKTDATDDASLAVTFRSGPPFKGTPASVWTINGEKGELMVISLSGPYLHSDWLRLEN